MTAFFLFTPILLAEAATPPCSLGPLAGETVFAKRVHDGDTLVLTNGEKLRLIGINTPELAREGRPSEPFSRKAQKRLNALVMNQPLVLAFDRQERDRYGRLLVHLFTKEGMNINAQLLKEGLATQILVPPNLGIASCYAKTETEARCQEKGLWKLKAYEPQGLSGLQGPFPGYRILEAKVERHELRNAHTLWLNEKHRIEISKKDFAAYFSNAWLQNIIDANSLIVRGWVHKKGGLFVLRVRHPRQISLKQNYLCSKTAP